MPHDPNRLGVLVDHLVPASTGLAIVDAVLAGSTVNMSVLGHTFIDVWQAVKSNRLGLTAWPEAPRAVERKHGTSDALGWSHASRVDIVARQLVSQRASH